MPATARQVRQALTKKLGFVSHHTDHELFELVVDGRVVAVTKISHHSSGRDIGDGLLGAMARQCYVSGPTFRGAVACVVIRDAFVSEVLDH